MLEVLIVGGGIGGLTLANALMKSERFRVTVLERDRDVHSRPQGGSISLRGKHALAVLKQIGLYESIAATGRSARDFRFVTTDGTVLLNLPPQTSSDEFVLQVSRARLREALLSGLPLGTVTWSSRAIGLRQSDSRAEVQLEDGGERSADLVVGCEGVRSPLRQQIIGDSLRPLGLATIGGVTAPLDHPLLKRGSCMTLGHGCSMLVMEFGESELQWAFTMHADEKQLGRLSVTVLRETVLDKIGRWHEPLAALVSATDGDRIGVKDLYDRAPVKRCRQGRVVLLGDAAHPMSPFRGNGGNMAMVDALELADVLIKTAEQDLDRALAAYERKARPRNRAAVLTSHKAAVELHSISPVSIWIRNAKLRAANRLIASATKASRFNAAAAATAKRGD
jgi:2-polyprenyl-6-methoxyphenol hydroxylase-like FAD-dependent oxidoreductase